MPGPDTMTQSKTNVSGPPKFKSVDHLSVPCRDLEEGIRFYRDVLGGELVVQGRRPLPFSTSPERASESARRAAPSCRNIPSIPISPSSRTSRR